MKMIVRLFGDDETEIVRFKSAPPGRINVALLRVSLNLSGCINGWRKSSNRPPNFRLSATVFEECAAAPDPFV